MDTDQIYIYCFWSALAHCASRTYCVYRMAGCCCGFWIWFIASHRWTTRGQGDEVKCSATLVASATHCKTNHRKTTHKHTTHQRKITQCEIITAQPRNCVIVRRAFISRVYIFALYDASLQSAHILGAAAAHVNMVIYCLFAVKPTSECTPRCVRFSSQKKNASPIKTYIYIYMMLVVRCSSCVWNCDGTINHFFAVQDLWWNCVVWPNSFAFSNTLNMPWAE